MLNLTRVWRLYGVLTCLYAELSAHFFLLQRNSTLADTSTLAEHFIADMNAFPRPALVMNP